MGAFGSEGYPKVGFGASAGFAPNRPPPVDGVDDGAPKSPDDPVVFPNNDVLPVEDPNNPPVGFLS